MAMDTLFHDLSKLVFLSTERREEGYAFPWATGSFPEIEKRKKSQTPRTMPFHSCSSVLVTSLLSIHSAPVSPGLVLGFVSSCDCFLLVFRGTI